MMLEQLLAGYFNGDFDFIEAVSATFLRGYRI